ncbi:MAG TPA: ribosomal protein S18-alanine N-acetyltransferase [Firmicutes bacterium]|jgi:ribosomal-protein-alanine N-acetyltransferase|nr:ribosomal protein S18-alanine N-acetyltransferase [Bacillota bacterium]
MKPEDDIQLSIDTMKISDIPGVQVIERHSFSTPWSMQAFIAEITQNDCARYLVIRSQEQVVGYIGMWVILDEGHITNVAVHPAWRRQGIGTRLIKEMAQLAYGLGVRRMTLEVRVSNYRAQALYRKLGFEDAGIRPKYYLDDGEDALIMWKELKSDEFEENTDTGN